MSPTLWALVVIVSFAGLFSVFKLWNKDTVGAVLWTVGIMAAFYVLLSIGGCTVPREYQPWLEAGFAYDTQGTVGSNPACIVRLRQPVGFGPLQPDWLLLGYTHHSSCPMQNDVATVDQIELVAKIPLGRRQ